jgi:hypothetical protein
MDAIFHLVDSLQDRLGDLATGHFLLQKHFMKPVGSQLAKFHMGTCKKFIGRR